MNKPVHQVLIRPLLTEKSVRNAQEKKYIFEVANDATKIDVAHAVEELFAKEKVKVASVNTMHVRGKQRRMSLRRGRRASVGFAPSWKKAIVTLTPESPNIPTLEGA